jgi:hypothetical protein
MSDDRPSLPPDRAELVERAAVTYAERPPSSTPIPDLIVEFDLSVAEACVVLQRVEQMRICRRAFA